MSWKSNIISWLRGAPRKLDVWINEHPLKWLHEHGIDLFSSYGGEPGTTISDSFGLEEAQAIEEEYRKHHDLINPGIPLEHPFGQLADALCTLFQCALTGEKVDHGLDSIDWNSKGAQDLMVKYPDLPLVIAKYEKANGLKVTV
jgi:hypothetical protein